MSASSTQGRLVVAALGLTQIIGYGTLYYSFTALAASMAQDFHWPQEWVFGAFSISLLAGGLAAPLAGTWIDRHGAGKVMALGSIGAAVALVACALAPNPILFAIGLMAIELASTFVLYNAAFALLVQINPTTAQRSITYLTLIAGFASTIFWPLTSALHATLSWQQVYYVFAAIHVGVCFPIHFWLASLSKTPKTAQTGTVVKHAVEGSLPAHRRQSVFVLMVSGIALISFIDAAILIHMLPMLTALGLGSASVLIGTLFGPAQVASRLFSMLSGDRIQPLGLALISALLVPVSICVLLLSGSWIAGALLFAVVFGLGAGLASIIQGTLPLALFGSHGYGQRVGKATAIRLIATSGAPFAFAFVMQHLGARTSLIISAVLGLVAVATFAAIGHASQRVLVREQS
ncbi:arsenite efflux MFS transporter ArsK (plasmid) [Phyllobacterium sp. 628]|uniref:arsenite efflux MFS transporter ArsK n=1 Tax=Phyllobacterium sp. 628 TaxID=2718938 RepID=UPI00166237FC|nr:arsenite efflux MFS transporter ArsK [Phyllobacterium sp. 628]QND54505.1 arsenite efflux MFS transporter ArsK [Phyllobacterium sp. 628]